MIEKDESVDLTVHTIKSSVALKDPYYELIVFQRRTDVDQYYEYMRSEEGIYLIKLFDERFPKEKISDVKKLDFILRLDKQND